MRCCLTTGKTTHSLSVIGLALALCGVFPGDSPHSQSSQGPTPVLAGTLPVPSPIRGLLQNLATACMPTFPSLSRNKHPGEIFTPLVTYFSFDIGYIRNNQDGHTVDSTFSVFCFILVFFLLELFALYLVFAPDCKQRSTAFVVLPLRSSYSRHTLHVIESRESTPQ